MRGAHSRLNSRPISVFNFTLMGNTVQICDCEMFSGPFLTYLREDDSYWTLLQRFSMITGEQHLGSTRIAVVVNNVPHFFAKPPFPANSSPSVPPKTNGKPPRESSETNKSEESIWDVIMKHYPTMSPSFLENPQQVASHLPDKFVCIGIQRSSADVKSLNNKSRYVSSLSLSCVYLTISRIP